MNVSEQTKRLMALLAKPTKYHELLDSVIRRLTVEESTNNVEQAVCDLGTLLGLVSSRPDKEHNTGPDVLWEVPEKKQGAALELKTEKEEESTYTKRDIGQCHDHAVWLAQNRDGSFYQRIVGPPFPVVPEANPDPELAVTGLDAFLELANRVKEAAGILVGGVGEDGERNAESLLRGLGLTWPALVDSLESRLAVDCQSIPDAPTE